MLVPMIRPLTMSDCEAYRSIRQKILQSDDARYFSDSYEREQLLSESQWLQWCTETQEHCILGTFVDDEMVGIIMITRQGGADSPIVEWEAAWLDPRYRGTGIGSLAYEYARQWSVSKGYKFVAGFIRATYTPALDICRKQGFVYAYTIPGEVWADGSVCDTHAYILDLRQESIATYQRTTNYLEEALAYLQVSLHAPPVDKAQVKRGVI